MPFAVLAILFVLGSAWSYLHSAIPPRPVAASVLSTEARERLVAERLTAFCEQRMVEAADEVAGHLHLCPGLIDVSATRFHVDLAYQGPRRDYAVAINTSWPSVGGHDWRDERGSALSGTTFRYSKEQGRRKVEISGNEPSAQRRREFLHRFLDASEACLAEGARLDHLAEAELFARPPGC